MLNARHRAGAPGRPPGRLRPRLAAASAVAVMAGTAGLPPLATSGAASAAASAPAAVSAVPAAPPGFTLTWSDDFTGAAGTGIDTEPGSTTPARAAASAPARSRR